MSYSLVSSIPYCHPTQRLPWPFIPKPIKINFFIQLPWSSTFLLQSKSPNFSKTHLLFKPSKIPPCLQHKLYFFQSFPSIFFLAHHLKELFQGSNSKSKYDSLKVALCKYPCIHAYIINLQYHMTFQLIIFQNTSVVCICSSPTRM